ncbi:Arabidopsis Toxicos en Levadura 96 [Hibiscus trionum]|uniref:RING-type E3 ubiquitin transferase n=1 Tax=Hibiscus trionum TaxID=183268 RepID=A0A9W7IWE7_HIBTR|nr:Arabidopsis Toxicos en Levadura 96 [Hibiscus trionum]
MALLQILSLVLLSVQQSTSAGICPEYCAGQSVHFPFRLSTQPDRCGYPGFNLSCKNQIKAMLSLPFAGEFVVRDIDYLYQRIWINDPGGCTPARLVHGLNLSGTPFEPQYPESYVFLNCSDAAISKQVPEVRYISCLSGETFSVVAIPVDRLDMYRTLLWSCGKIAEVLVPDWDPIYGMGLRWTEPNCMGCELGGGTCMFKSDTGLDIRCSGGFNSGISTSAKLGIIFGAGIPLLCTLGLVCHLRRKANDFYNHHQHHNSGISVPVVGSSRSAAGNAKGLDGPTIEAYPITVLDESRRLSRPGDNTCSICLCEYQANEKLRTIPDCKHYFHAVCLDEWLKRNSACPLCRNTPHISAAIVSS